MNEEIRREIIEKVNEAFKGLELRREIIEKEIIEIFNIQNERETINKLATQIISHLKTFSNMLDLYNNIKTQLTLGDFFTIPDLIRNLAHLKEKEDQDFEQIIKTAYIDLGDLKEAIRLFKRVIPDTLNHNQLITKRIGSRIPVNKVKEKIIIKKPIKKIQTPDKPKIEIKSSPQEERDILIKDEGPSLKGLGAKTVYEKLKNEKRLEEKSDEKLEEFIFLDFHNFILSVNLKENDNKEILKFPELSREIKSNLRRISEKEKKNKDSLKSFIKPAKKSLVIPREDYLEMIRIKHSIINNRSIEDDKYLVYLLATLGIKDLKTICRDHTIKNYSELKKHELVKHIILNLSNEEQRDYLIENELDIIALNISKAKTLIAGNDKQEKIKSIDFKENRDNEIEIKFQGIHWKSESYISICKENIDDPDRDCDCKFGEAQGFCKHFWIGFIESIKKGYLDLKNWRLTQLPLDMYNYEKK